MAIQQAVNQALTTAAVGAAGYKHFTDVKKEELAKIEHSMTQAALKAGGVPDEEAANFATAEALGLKVAPEYQGKYDLYKQIKAEKVLQSETLAKARQSETYRKRLFALRGDLDSVMTQDLHDVFIQEDKK